jgi:hypothetical protein
VLKGLAATKDVEPTGAQAAVLAYLEACCPARDVEKVSEPPPPVPMEYRITGPVTMSVPFPPAPAGLPPMPGGPVPMIVAPRAIMAPMLAVPPPPAEAPKCPKACPEKE